MRRSCGVDPRKHRVGSVVGRKTSDLVIDVEDLACLVLGVRCAASDREIVSRQWT